MFKCISLNLKFFLLITTKLQKVQFYFIRLVMMITLLFSYYFIFLLFSYIINEPDLSFRNQYLKCIFTDSYYQNKY